MTFNKSLWTSYGVMTVFVLLWGSAAIFTRWGLDHGTPFALLIVRFALALTAVLLIGLYRRRCGQRLALLGRRRRPGC
jgi:drug/metabolite transporter (DMT)-like permease